MTMKIPKDVGGVAIPNDLRRMAKKVVGRIDSPVGRDAAIAGLTLAAAAVIAISGAAGSSTDTADDLPDAPEPSTPPSPPEPPRPPEPPLRTAERVSSFTMPPITPAQTQAVADALGNAAQAALTRFLAGKRAG
jgi:hypothetical protein